MSEQSVLVQVPASTSNCGPGFDTLSIALSLYNFVRLTPRTDSEIRPVGELLPSTQVMVSKAASAFVAAAGVASTGFDYEIWGEVPRARGLGSSSTVRAGIVAGLNELNGRLLDQEAMIRLTTQLDNAPDNACAAFAGGFCIARTEPKDFSYREHVRFDLPNTLNFIAVSPDYEVLTEDSRLVLPRGVLFDDVVRSANSLAFLVGVFVSGDYERLKGAVNDYMHQPYREKLNPFGRESIEAGCHAGAYAGWLSGSGSTVMCIADDEHAAEVGSAMQTAYEANGVKARVFRLHADNEGLKIV
ncbi:homoserine kinase [Coraliomargarita akajimensis]|uniref:Homoserine kinase n=1 Tax=Coraliomargarita akajimensis (strain DSM 45221 / IAM 15411 / JCM 23193 / KCTC 12865 / 04OKA010-24) TaxID=583355 RepID=D5ELM1_CORAD|nr:homoserine kinase [Coraliomargarita akajimensis]ADE53196.1 homoserine kinase [Coraliomargarita akajimensis DSM 45221]